MTESGGDRGSEYKFQNEIIQAMVSNGWLPGESSKYNRTSGLYEEDGVSFVRETQDAQWQKYAKLYPSGPEQKLLERVAVQLGKADPMRRTRRCAPSAPWGCCDTRTALISAAVTGKIDVRSWEAPHD